MGFWFGGPGRSPKLPCPCYSLAIWHLAHAETPGFYSFRTIFSYPCPTWTPVQVYDLLFYEFISIFWTKVEVSKGHTHFWVSTVRRRYVEFSEESGQQRFWEGFWVIIDYAKWIWRVWMITVDVGTERKQDKVDVKWRN